MRRTRFALRSLAKRALHDRLVLVATAISVLCALVLIAAGPIYARGVSTATLRRQLTDLDVEATTATVTVRSPVAHLDAVDAVTRPVLDTLNTDVGGDIVTHATTGSFSLPGRESELTVLRWAPGVDESVMLAEGRWPGTGAATVEVVTSAGAASAAGLAVGDTIELGAQRSLPNLEVVVVGLFDSWPDDLIRPGDELLRSGVDQGGSFTTIGPLVVGDPSVLPADAFVDLEWWVRPDLAAVDDANVDALREQATSLERDVDNALRRGLGGSTYRTLSALDVRTGLDAALAASERSLTVTRANVMAVLIQISLLAGFAIVLTAELVAATRTDETILSHARGAGRRTIVGAAVAEALAVVVPLAIVAPWIAARALQGLEVVGPIAEIDLNLDLAVGGQAWTAVTVAALFATGFLVWPAAGIVSTDLESSRRNRRSSARARFQRAGVDLALVVIALVAVWQLRELGSRRSERADGAFGVDPLLVVAPAVATLAGGVLALRVIPVAARLGEAIAARRRSAVAALTAWQVARRPRRHTRSALLLVLAVAIGFFAATYSATWRQSQEDQSRHQVGSDARVTPDRRVGEAIPDINLIAEAEALDNVGAVIGVERRPADLPAASRPGQVLLMDAAVAAEVVDVVGVAPAELDGLMAALTEHRPTPVGITIDGVVDAIGVDVIVDQPIPPVEEPPGGPDEEDPDGEDVPPAPPEPPRFDGRLDLVVVDGRGSLHRLAGPRLAVEGATERVTFDVTGSGGLRIDPPLTLLDFEVRSVMPTGIATPVSLAISGVLALDGDTWRAVPFDSSDGAWRLDRTSNPTFARQPGITHVANDPDGTLAFDLELGVANQPAPATYAIQAVGPRRPATVPVVVSDAWLEEAAAEIGDSFAFDDVLGPDARVTVVGSVPLIPTVDQTVATGVIADRPTAQLAAHRPGRPIADLTEVWVGLEPTADPADAEAVFLNGPLRAADVVTQRGLEDDLSTDPIALGTAGALAVGFGAAAIVTAIGFAVSGAVSARERAGEFALLRALGLSSRQLGRWLALEQGLTVAVSLALGTAVGWLLSTAVLPLTSLTQEGVPVVPDVRVVYPWRSILLLDLALVATLGLIVIVLTVALRRVGVGQRLRSGGDR